MIPPEAFQALNREAHVFGRLVEREACVALGDGEAGNGAMGRFAASHEETIVTIQCRNARFELGNFSVETVDTCPAILAISEIDATEGRHHKGLILFGYDGHVGPN
jgi:hypothetical protein